MDYETKVAIVESLLESYNYIYLVGAIIFLPLVVYISFKIGHNFDRTSLFMFISYTILCLVHLEIAITQLTEADISDVTTYFIMILEICFTAITLIIQGYFLMELKRVRICLHS
jgi:hypothetical protein